MVWSMWNMQNPQQISTNAFLLLSPNKSTDISSLNIENLPDLFELDLHKVIHTRPKRQSPQPNLSKESASHNLYSFSKYDCPIMMFSSQKSTTDTSPFRSHLHMSNPTSDTVWNRTNLFYPTHSNNNNNNNNNWISKSESNPFSAFEPKTQTQQPCFDPFQPVYITATQGSNAMIPCKVHNIDFSSTVMSWWREDSPVQLTVGNELSSTRFSLDKSDPLSWTLVISRVTDADTGTYICQINLAHLKEKFFHLKVIPPQPLPDTAKLNDEYVKDEAVKIVAMQSGPSQQQQKSLLIVSSPGPPHTLTCFARFDQRNPESTIQWIHDRTNPNTRAFGQLNKYSDTNQKLFNLDSLDTSTVSNGPSIQTRWLNKTTLSSVLRLGVLSAKNAGVWTCRKIPGTLSEFIEETSVTLHPDSTDHAIRLHKPYEGSHGRSHQEKNAAVVNYPNLFIPCIIKFLLVWLIQH